MGLPRASMAAEQQCSGGDCNAAAVLLQKQRNISTSRARSLSLSLSLSLFRKHIFSSAQKCFRPTLRNEQLTLDAQHKRH